MVYGPSYHKRDIDEIVQEVRQMPGRKLFFLDANLTADKSFAKQLFRALIPLRRIWAAQVSLDFTADRLAAGAEMLAALWYTAWLEGTR